MPQPWILFLWICPVCGYVPPGLRGALAVESPSHGHLGAKDFVRMLQEASTAKGIPENWPDSQLDIATAKLVIELERARILAWKEWAMQEAAYCQDHPKQRRSSLRGRRPQRTGAARFWPKAVAILLATPCIAVGIRVAMRWLQERRHNVQALTLELQGCCDRSPTNRTPQQTELPAARSELESREHGDASPRGASRKELCPRPPAWLRDDQQPPWSAARHSSRFMVQPREWSEEFDGAYIGLVEEFGDEVASGFGGAVKQARWADFAVASKSFHRGDCELFAELYYGLLIGASPVIGFGVTPEGHPRLVSAWLQETSLQCVRRMASTEARCLEASKRFMCDLLLAVMSVHSIGLVHGDIKPDNIMLGVDETLYLIDYGSVSRPGDCCPMSCVHFSPPDDIMTYSYDVFATGRVLQELEREGLNLCACGKSLCADMCADSAKERPCLQQCLSRLLGCKCSL